MKYLFIIEKTGKVNPIIKKVEAVESDEGSSTKKYKDENGEIQYAYVNRVFCYDTEQEARNKIEELANRDIDEEKNKLIEAFNKLETKKADILKSIEVTEIRPILPFEKELNKNDLYITKKGDEYELYMGFDKAVVFLVDCDSSEELQEVFIKECKHHLEMIATEDEHYFDDCDAEYLKNEWKDLVEMILKIVEK